MRPLVLIIASVFIKAFSIWQRLQNSSNETKRDKQDLLNKVSKTLANNIFFYHDSSILVLLNRSKNLTSEISLLKFYGRTYLEY